MADWVRSGAGRWVLDTPDMRYRITQLATDAFVINRLVKSSHTLNQFGAIHRTLAQAKTWVDHDRS